MSRPIRLVLAAVVAVLMLCCDGSASSESRIGNLGDRSYGGLRSRPPRPSASGEPLDMTRFDGRFVWADYAAPWCSTCSRQVPELEQVRGFLGSDIGFMTVLTSDMGGYGDPASEATARRWASQHRLAPDRVVAADLTSMAVPRHVLFSPEGHMLFEWTGYFSAEQILEVTERRMADWEAWKRSGTRAHWMTGGES
jgi:hypothetical protein